VIPTIWQPDTNINVDIRLNDGDIGYSAQGDLDIVGNAIPADNVWQAVVLRLMTSLGTYLFAEDYGTRLRQYVEEPMTAALKKSITAQISATVTACEKVKKITSLTVTASDDPQGYVINLCILTNSNQTVNGSISMSSGG